jgi:hypothetical protein
VHDEGMQVPPEQLPPVQAAPHAPQFCGSLVTSMQPLPQSVIPAGHTQVPFEQTVLKKHG